MRLPRAFEDRVAEALLGPCGHAAGGGIVAGVSGGPDSTALLVALAGLVARGVLAGPLVAAHLHHGIRGAAADRDALAADRLAAVLGVPFHAGRADVPGQARRARASLETAGRAARLAFLGAAALAAGARSIVLGHQAGDQVETVAMNLLRGAGPAGLKGIPAVRPLSPGSPVRVVHPLLAIPRTEIAAALSAAGIPSCTDESNLLPRGRRNLLRLRVLPLLRRRGVRDLDERLLALAGAAREAADRISAIAARFLEGAAGRTEDGDLRIPRSALDAAILSGDPRGSAPERFRAILEAALAGAGGPAITRRRLRAVARFYRTAPEGASFAAGRGVVLRLAGGELRVAAAAAPVSAASSPSRTPPAAPGPPSPSGATGCPAPS